MFTRADKFQDVRRDQSRDDELRDQFPRSQPHPARSFEQSSSLMRIGNTVTIKGDLTAAENMVIYGRLEGTITVADHTLTIGKGATIKADVKAHSLVVEGHITGNVETAEQLEISPDGVILGDVRTPSLVIRDGATLRGSVDMDATRPRVSEKAQDQKPAAAVSNDDKSSSGKPRPKDERLVTT
jgi:cytoskeletal protein CcmA (bactofilin family)